MIIRGTIKRDNKLEKIYKDEQLGEITFRKKKGVRRMSIRVHPVKGVSVTMPYRVPYAAAMAFFKLKRDWVVQTVMSQKARLQNIPKADQETIEALRKQAKVCLPQRLKELADRYGFVYNRVAIKHNATNWGSCSTKNNINLNLNIVRLPQALRDYILLHELCHLRHRDHGQAFHLLLEHLCTDNILKLIDAGDADAKELARAVAVSRARYPMDYVCTKAIKKYPLV